MGGIEIAKEFLNSLPDVKKDTPCVIIIQDKQIKLPSGKSAWKSKGAARSAFTNALGNVIGVRHPAMTRQVLEDEGFVKFKEARYET